ncbi:hypothetical protein RCL1_000629 [Eukaryota sp. TZLM3-RCL]
MTEVQYLTKYQIQEFREVFDKYELQDDYVPIPYLRNIVSELGLGTLTSQEIMTMCKTTLDPQETGGFGFEALKIVLAPMVVDLKEEALAMELFNNLTREGRHVIDRGDLEQYLCKSFIDHPSFHLEKLRDLIDDVLRACDPNWTWNIDYDDFKTIVMPEFPWEFLFPCDFY